MKMKTTGLENASLLEGSFIFFVLERKQDRRRVALAVRDVSRRFAPIYLLQYLVVFVNENFLAIRVDEDVFESLYSRIHKFKDVCIHSNEIEREHPLNNLDRFLKTIRNYGKTDLYHRQLRGQGIKLIELRVISGSFQSRDTVAEQGSQLIEVLRQTFRAVVSDASIPSLPAVNRH